MRALRFILAILILGIPLSANAQNATFEVAASNAILADLIKQVAGNKVKIKSIIPGNIDPHAFEISPKDVIQFKSTKMVVLNGLNFEPWAKRLIEAANYQGEVVIASKGIKALKVRGSIDPHAWQDIENTLIYVSNIRDALVKLDPKNRTSYEIGADLYIKDLKLLDSDMRKSFAQIPRENRNVVTSHEAFNYFSDAYGIIFYAPQGVSFETEASARDISKLIRQIKDLKIRAVFFEGTSSSQILKQVSKETGVRIGGTLYSDNLDHSVTSYIAMMKHNQKTILGAIK